LETVLRVPGLTAFTIKACVLRHEVLGKGEIGVALAFEDVPAWIENRIQEAVSSALERKERCGGPAVLVVDDDPPVRLALARQLGSIGCRAVLAATPLDAIQGIEGRVVPADTALVDLFLGTADGLELLEFLANDYPGVRRVLMSGQVRPSQLELARTSGRAHAVLQKPWDRESLVDAVAV
jgi:CheY-like chemotaxis protein